jgi:cytochrome c-type biogenesis protein CcsB
MHRTLARTEEDPMSDPSLAQLADTLVWLAVLTYLAAAALLGLELGYRVRWPGRAGLAAAVAGLTLNAGAAGARGLAADRVPWGNLYEVSSMLGLLLVAGYLAWVWRRPETRPLGPFVLLPAVLAIAAGSLLAYAPAGPLVPALTSGWLRIHVAAAITGCSTLALSGLFSLLFLGKDRAERRAVRRPPLVAGGAQTAERAQVAQRLADHADTRAQLEVEASSVPSTPRSVWKHLPAAQTLDELAYRTTASAFPIWTFGIIAGAVWGQAAWGRYWGWDPKETWSFIVWVLYAAYLHARATAGWRGRRAAWISALGVAAIAFNVYAVNLWLAGLHSYAT